MQERALLRVIRLLLGKHMQRLAWKVVWLRALIEYSAMYKS